MELIKKTLNVREAQNWYLMQDEKRTWIEDVEDEETGEITSVERSDIVCGRGSLITEIIISLLEENGINSVKVSSIPIRGNQMKYMNLWEAALKVSAKGGSRKKNYIVYNDSPAEAEAFISEYFEINIEGAFEIVGVKQVEYNRVIKVYDTERDEYEQSGKHLAKWYKCQIYATVGDDDDAEDVSGGSRSLLVLAFSFEKAIQAVKTVFGRDEFDSIYRTFKVVQELTIVDVFVPDEKVSYYSDNEL